MIKRRNILCYIQKEAKMLSISDGRMDGYSEL